MFNKHFNRNRYHEVEKSRSAFTYCGDIEGDAVNELRFELTKRTSLFPEIENAWLAKIQYSDEDTIRVMLFVNAPGLSANNCASIANACADLIPMDIVFADYLSSQLANQIRQGSKPLYLDNNNLYLCPIIVECGENTSAPTEWIGAIINIYVADTDYESALERAALQVGSEGYLFTGVHENRVAQLDPEQWWEMHVLGDWPDYSDHFPTQAEIRCLVRCGGIFTGPALGWESNPQQST